MRRLETDREKHGLRGLIRSVLVETARFEEQSGQLTEQPWFTQTMTFNEDGCLTEQTSSNPDGWQCRTVSDYSDSHNVVKTRTYDISGALVREVKYIYDDEERLVAEQQITPDGKVTTPITYVYDNDGLKTKLHEHDYSESEYEDMGVVIEETFTTIDASEMKRTETRYDDQGNAVEVKVFNADGSLITRTEITRDDRGNPLEETQYHGDVVRFGTGSSPLEEIDSLSDEDKAEFAAAVAQMFAPGTSMSKQIHEYDSEGRRIESKLMVMGMVVNRQTFAYDEAGGKAEEVSYNPSAPEGSKTLFTREYDEHGNWTKELVSTVSSWDAEFGLSTPSHVIRRTITYYT